MIDLVWTILITMFMIIVLLLFFIVQFLDSFVIHLVKYFMVFLDKHALIKMHSTIIFEFNVILLVIVTSWLKTNPFFQRDWGGKFFHAFKNNSLFYFIL